MFEAKTIDEWMDGSIVRSFLNMRWQQIENQTHVDICCLECKKKKQKRKELLMFRLKFRKTNARTNRNKLGIFF